MDTQGQPAVYSPTADNIDSPPFAQLEALVSVNSMDSVSMEEDFAQFSEVAARRPRRNVGRYTFDSCAKSALEFFDADLVNWNPSEENVESEKRRRTSQLFLDLKVCGLLDFLVHFVFSIARTLFSLLIFISPY